MSESSIASLGDGVAGALNDAAPGTFSETFTAVYAFAPNYSTMDAKTLRVVVTDAGGEIALASRAQALFTDAIRVVVLWRVDAGATGLDDTAMRRALTLLEEITLFLLGRSVAGYAQDGTATRGAGEKEHAHYMAGNLEDRVFAASIIFPYQSRVARIRTEGAS